MPEIDYLDLEDVYENVPPTERETGDLAYDCE
jgi:hypothetical protein